MRIGEGKEPEVGALAAEGECLLSVNSLLVRHLSPESSARRRQRQFTYFATIWYRSCLSESSQCILIRLWSSSEKGLVLRTQPGGVHRLLVFFPRSAQKITHHHWKPHVVSYDNCWIGFHIQSHAFLSHFVWGFPRSRCKVWCRGTVTTENTRSRLERGA